MTSPPPPLLGTVVPEAGRAVPETWVKIFGGYSVSSLGRVRSHRVNSPILRGTIDRHGYVRVRLAANGKKTAFRVHRLVCEAFHGLQPQGATHAAHLDGNRRNNAASNLAWKTPEQNEADKREHGSHLAGERHPRARLTQQVVEQIKASPQGHRPLGRALGVSESTVRKIRSGETWAS